MSDKYKISDNDKAYFVTLTTVGWIDIFVLGHKPLIQNWKWFILSIGTDNMSAPAGKSEEKVLINPNNTNSLQLFNVNIMYFLVSKKYQKLTADEKLR